MSERSRRGRRALAGLAVAALVAGCAPTGVVVLLPEKGGRATAVDVRQDDKSVTLDQPYAAAQFTRQGPKPFESNADDVQRRFGAALGALPARPIDFELQFELGKNELTAESRRKFDEVLAELAKRPVADVRVIGHTDTSGADELNDRLSRDRAGFVRDELVKLGLKAESIEVLGRGKRAPKYGKPDGPPDDRDRRVEVFVR